tara:strand:+ start:81 stop:212 length:132 start_codon:yes stop_codon:yes gene_type:complete
LRFGKAVLSLHWPADLSFSGKVKVGRGGGMQADRLWLGGVILA